MSRAGGADPDRSRSDGARRGGLLRSAAWIGVAIALAVATWPVLRYGYPRGHDWRFELTRVAELGAALDDGQLPPAWAPDLYGGYGSPLFLFYAPLFPALAHAASWAGNPATGATIALLATLLLAAVAAALMVSCALGEDFLAGGAGVRIGLYLFLLHPYLLTDALLRNANSELLGLALGPLVLAAVFAARSRPRGAALALAPALALAILAHNLTALVLAALTGVAALLLYLPRRPRALLAVGLGTGGALALSAWFWVPALALGGLMRREELLRGHLDFRQGFPTAAQLFDGSVYFSAGPLTLLVLLVAALSLLRTPAPRDVRRILGASLLAAALFVLLMTPLSLPLWESLPWLPLFQFPWRMMGGLALVSALAGGLAFHGLTRNLGRRARGLSEAAVLALVLLNAFPVLSHHRPLPLETLASLPRTLGPEAIRRAGLTATVYDEYLPPSAEPALWPREGYPGPIRSAAPETRVEVLRDAGTQLEIEVDAPVATAVELARWYFPGWEVEVDGMAVEPERGPGGTLVVPVDAGRHGVALRYRAPRVRRLMLVLGLAAAVIWSALALRAVFAGREDV